MRALLIGCSLLVLTACAAKPPARAPIKVGEEFTLALGESVGIDQKNVIVAFEKVVEDSRCPMNARCIWEGNARIALKATEFTPGHAANTLDVAEKTHELNTSTRFSTREKITDFVIELRRLEPDRLAGTPTKGYVATLFVGVP